MASRRRTTADFGFLRQGSMAPEDLDADQGFDDDHLYEEVDSFNPDIDIFGRSDRAPSLGESSKGSIIEEDEEYEEDLDDGVDRPPMPPSSSTVSTSSTSSTKSYSGLHIRTKAKRFLSGSKSGGPKLSAGGIASQMRRGMGSKYRRPEGAGLIYHAQVVSDDYFDLKTCTTDGHLKNRRPIPIVRASEFFADLEYTGGKWIRRAPLNGWDGLTDLQLLSITGKVKSMGQTFRVRRYWCYDSDKQTRPAFPEKSISVRITLLAPEWTQHGFSPNNPGYTWWFNRFDDTFFHGEDIAKNFRQLEATRGVHEATKVHHFAHRYAKARESTKDKIVYHSAILLEWSHGKYCTIFELAFYSGVGGYGGRSNWHEDSISMDPPPKLLNAFPNYMIRPWNSTLAEVRMNDVPYKNWEEFTTYLTDHESPSGSKDHRFLDVNHIASADVKLATRSESAIATFVNNYTQHNREYHEESRNCQTFAADFYRLLTGDSNVKPFHTICQILYHQHVNWFLYSAT